MCNVSWSQGIKDSGDPLGMAHKTRQGSSPLERASDPLGLKDKMKAKPAPATTTRMDPRIDSSPETLSSQLDKRAKAQRTVLASGELEQSTNVLAKAGA